ncbi:MAG TPA: beta-N-acetylglucosaminidase domain-containing protein [Cellvibrio sp.]|nr:beta-N-acetylglucosaminidase domain-containing protein [Cellvibrio sp.]
MTTNKHYVTPRGIIEGFFGRSWSWEDRKKYAHFLALNEYDFYIYAPKDDKNLRKHWQTDWPGHTKESLLDLRQTYRETNVKFGIGLSPHEIYLNYSSQQSGALLNQRIEQLNRLEPDILCILFDDMRGNIPGLAQMQIDIAHQAAATSNANKIIFCPTYYSFDPVLEKVFGAMPENYWQTFAQNLDRNIEMFWTGEKVCSTNYSAKHLAEVTDLIGRQPFLWDNYPVNDGAVKSNLLQLRAFDQSHGQLSGKIAGHAVNPMNQPWLSRIPLASLPIAYREQNNYSPDAAFIDICKNLCGDELAGQLQQDINQLQERGLKNFSSYERALLVSSYERFGKNPYALEIIAWLKNEYQFDPACLTE